VGRVRVTGLVAAAGEHVVRLP